MLIGEVEVGMRFSSKQWTYGLPVTVTRLHTDQETGQIIGFDFAYEETFSRHFRPGPGSWRHQEMLNWKQLERVDRQAKLCLI